MQLSPADYLVHVFGGVRATARALRKPPGTICRWQKTRQIPLKQLKTIIVTAKRQGIELTLDDLVYGREVPDES